jgi:steroid delta-isomerase-like uncharacterized protein
MSPKAKKNRDVVVSEIEALNRGEIEHIGKALKDEGVLGLVSAVEPRAVGRFKNARELQNAARSARRAFPDLKLNVEDTVATEDRVVVRWTATATHKKDFQGIKARGRKGSLEGVCIVEMDDGQVVNERVFFDSEQVRAQLGGKGPFKLDISALAAGA